MKVKDKVIRQALKRIDRRLEKIQSILDEKPLSGIIKIRTEANQVITENKHGLNKIGELLESLSKEEKRLFAVAKKQRGTQLIDEKVELEEESRQLKAELYYLEAGL